MSNQIILKATHFAEVVRKGKNLINEK